MEMPKKEKEDLCWQAPGELRVKVVQTQGLTWG